MRRRDQLREGVTTQLNLKIFTTQLLSIFGLGQGSSNFFFLIKKTLLKKKMPRN